GGGGGGRGRGGAAGEDRAAPPFRTQPAGPAGDGRVGTGWRLGGPVTGRFKTSHSWALQNQPGLLGVLIHSSTLTGSTFCSKYQTSAGFLSPPGMTSFGPAVRPLFRHPAIARTGSNGVLCGALGAGGRFGWF